MFGCGQVLKSKISRHSKSSGEITPIIPHYFSIILEIVVF